MQYSHECEAFCARSYPRHACPLYVVFFMHLHDLRKSPPVLADLSKDDPQSIMRFHAALSCTVKEVKIRI